MAINRRKPRELACIGGFLEVAPMMMVMMTLWSPQDTAEIVTMSGSSGRLGHRLAIFQRYDRLIGWFGYGLMKVASLFSIQLFGGREM